MSMKMHFGNPASLTYQLWWTISFELFLYWCVPCTSGIQRLKSSKAPQLWTSASHCCITFTTCGAGLPKGDCQRRGLRRSLHGEAEGQAEGGGGQGAGQAFWPQSRAFGVCGSSVKVKRFNLFLQQIYFVSHGITNPLFCTLSNTLTFFIYGSVLIIT